jgi:hypothetical protein
LAQRQRWPGHGGNRERQARASWQRDRPRLDDADEKAAERIFNGGGASTLLDLGDIIDTEFLGVGWAKRVTRSPVYRIGPDRTPL